MTAAENGWAAVAKFSETKQEGETCLQGTKLDLKGTDRRQTQK